MGWSFRDAVQGVTFLEHVGLRVKGGQHSIAQIDGEQERERRELEKVPDAKRNTDSGWVFPF
jgi:predicted ABC-type ATPase